MLSREIKTEEMRLEPPSKSWLRIAEKHKAERLIDTLSIVETFAASGDLHADKKHSAV